MSFAGSAQMLADVQSFKASPVAELANYMYLCMRVLAGSAHGRRRDLKVPAHARCWVWLPKPTWTKSPRLHDGFYSQQRGVL